MSNIAVVPNIRCSFEANGTDIACPGMANVENVDRGVRKVETWVRVAAAANTPDMDHTMGNGKI